VIDLLNSISTGYSGRSKRTSSSLGSVLECTPYEIGPFGDGMRVSLHVPLIEDETRCLLASPYAHHVADERKRCPFRRVLMNQATSVQAAQIENHARA